MLWLFVENKDVYVTGHANPKHDNCVRRLSEIGMDIVRARISLLGIYGLCCNVIII